MRLTYKGKSLKFREIEVRPERQQKAKEKNFKRRKPNIPSAEHPWRKFKIRGVYEAAKTAEKYDGGSSLKTGHFYLRQKEFLIALTK